MKVGDEEINEIYRELIRKVGWKNHNKEKIEISIEDKRVRHALAIYKSISDEEKFSKEGLEDTCQKLNFIRYFCIIELILKEKVRQKSRQFNSLGAILLGYKNEWWIQKVYESLNAIYDLRNKLVHEYNYSIENKEASKTSDIEPEYLSSNLQKIVYLLILRVVDEDGTSFIRNLRDKWNSLYQYSNQIPLFVPRYEQISNSIPPSIFDDSIKKIIAKNFGNEKMPENSFSLKLSAYGGLLLKTDYTINIEKYFHTSDIRSSETRILPNKDELEKLKGVLINEISKSRDSDSLISKLNSKNKKNGKTLDSITLFSKSPQSLVFEIGWLFNYVNFSIYTTLEIRKMDDIDKGSNYKFIYYRIQDNLSDINLEENITLCQKVLQEGDRGTLLIIKPNDNMIKTAMDKFKNYTIISCFNEGLVINNENGIQICAKKIIELIETIKSEEIHLILRLPTALVLQLGYSACKLGKTIHLHEWRQKNSESEPDLHEFFTLRKEEIEEQISLQS